MTPRRLVELSHPFGHGTTTYPGLPGPEIGDPLPRADAVGPYPERPPFQPRRTTMVSNTGTYLDTPFHRYADGADLSGVGLERLADLEGLVIDRSGGAGRGSTAGVIDGLDVAGKAVLLRTGWDRHWGTEQYAIDAPFVAADLAPALVDAEATPFGLDTEHPA